MFMWNFMYSSLCLLPSILSLGTTTKSLVPFFRFPPTRYLYAFIRSPFSLLQAEQVLLNVSTAFRCVSQSSQICIISKFAECALSFYSAHDVCSELFLGRVILFWIHGDWRDHRLCYVEYECISLWMKFKVINLIV